MDLLLSARVEKRTVKYRDSAMDGNQGERNKEEANESATAGIDEDCPSWI